MERYVPLSRRRSPDAEQAHLEARHDGVPPWLRESLWAWIEAHIGATYGSTSHYRGISEYRLREAERMLEFDIGWAGDGLIDGLDRLRNAITTDPILMLDLAEFLAVRYATDQSRELLEELLAEAGSAWRVLPGGRFTERVTRAVQDAADAAFGRGTAGQLLQHAWAAAFGRSPNPSDAYRNAIRAVEAAAKPVITPADDLATLGKMIGALRDGAHKFAFAFVVDSKVKPHDVLVGMLQMLWTNQYDRHVSDDAPLHVSQQEAEAAVVLALTLVEWFTSGKVTRRP